jgi:protein-L-isoaspartate(D-aspartate) O-methyltransferase
MAPLFATLLYPWPPLIRQEMHSPMKQTEIEQARFNMIEQQIRPWDVLDQQVLDTMNAIHREDFVPERYRSLAFADTSIPLGHEQVMMAPKLEGRLLQALAITPTDHILEIGTGSGYLTACLARLGQQVTSFDIMPDFTAAAGEALQGMEISNVSLHTADVANGIDSDERYDAIAVTGSLPVLQQQFHNNLSIGGRLFVITGSLPVMEAWLITRIDENNWARESLLETCIPPLLNAATAQEFIF